MSDLSKTLASHPVYPKQLELKLEHQGEHAAFLDLDIRIVYVF